MRKTRRRRANGSVFALARDPKARAVMQALAIVRDVLSRCRQAADVAAPVDQNRHQRRVLAGQLPLAARALVSAAAIERASAMTEETLGYFAFASR